MTEQELARPMELDRKALGVVDCHAHIFDRFDRYPLAGARKYSPPLCAREAWLALHAALGVERGVQVHASPYGFDNSITYDFLREHPGRFLGVASRLGEGRIAPLRLVAPAGAKLPDFA